jgi:isopentenyl-diphosphate delta-isomerase
MTSTTAPAGPAAEEQVVLCSPRGDATGTAPKSAVHHRDTPLHLAFSCYVFDPHGRILVTRRSRAKSVFPGVRTNSCCGHPAPGEGMTAAVRRRLQQELGVVASGVDLILPTFRYRATAADGTVENELCPVYRAVTADDRLRPDVTEVDDAWWVPWTQFCTAATGDTAVTGDGGDAADPLSPWATEQVRQLAALGPDPLRWPAGARELLPPAALP